MIFIHVTRNCWNVKYKLFGVNGNESSGFFLGIIFVIVVIDNSREKVLRFQFFLYVIAIGRVKNNAKTIQNKLIKTSTAKIHNVKDQ